jgi:4a-hydroxytetrahydrobiopterin dehydratase
VSLPRQKAITQTFGWGYATVSLNTKKIKGLHENDFIMASKIDRLLDRPDRSLDHKQSEAPT